MGGQLAALALLVMAATGTLQGMSLAQSSAASVGSGPRTTRVRCLDPEACRAFAEALAASPTVVRLVDELQGSDLIVCIDSSPFEKVTRGQLRLLAAVAGVRYLRIRLTIPFAPVVMTSVLGHELQHALEIAAMAEVRDEASLGQAYRRIGFATRSGGYYETEAALTTGRRVAEEAERAARASNPRLQSSAQR